MKINLFNNKLAFLVLLTRLVGSEVGPADNALASFAVNVTNCMKSSHETPLFASTTSNIHTLIK
jgi:hypothetical protein